MANPVDPARVAFVKREYAYQSAENTSIKSTYGDAKEIVLDTNLNKTDAQTLANLYFAEFSGPSRGYTIEIEGIVDLKDFVGAAPRYTLAQDRYSDAGLVFTAVYANCDYENNRTLITVRSS